MDSRHSYILAVLFHIPVFFHKVSADLNSLFGTTSNDDDAVLYVTLGFLILSVILITCMILCLYWLYKVIKKRIKKRQEQLAMEERRRWQGGVDDIIYDVDKMVPLPRAGSTSESYTNGSYVSGGSIDFVSSRI